MNRASLAAVALHFLQPGGILTSQTPTVIVELAWEGGLRFRGRAGERELRLDGDSAGGVSPVEALALALAGCMGSDVVHILVKGRVELEGLSARLVAERAPEEPRRLVKVDLRFTVRGAVPGDKVERAITLSRERYCSVWHSLRPDIAFTTSYEVSP
jgi:putative redox protein